MSNAGADPPAYDNILETTGQMLLSLIAYEDGIMEFTVSYENIDKFPLQSTRYTPSNFPAMYRVFESGLSGRGVNV